MFLGQFCGSDGNEATDTRAVLSGAFADADTIVTNAAAIAITAEAFALLGDTASRGIAALDIAALLGEDGPLPLGDGTCLNAELEFLEVDSLNATGGVGQDVPPRTGQIRNVQRFCR